MGLTNRSVRLSMAAVSVNVCKELTLRDVVKVAGMSMVTVQDGTWASGVAFTATRSFRTDELVRISQRRGA